VDRQHPHRAGRTIAMHVKVGGHSSMMPGRATCRRGLGGL